MGMRRFPNVALMLAHRLRRWAIIEQHCANLMWKTIFPNDNMWAGVGRQNES